MCVYQQPIYHSKSLVWFAIARLCVRCVKIKQLILKIRCQILVKNRNH